MYYLDPAISLFHYYEIEKHERQLYAHVNTCMYKINKYK